MRLPGSSVDPGAGGRIGGPDDALERGAVGVGRAAAPAVVRREGDDGVAAGREVAVGGATDRPSALVAACGATIGVPS